MTASFWTADTPRWLVLLLLAVVATAYAACGLLATCGARRRRTVRRSTSPARVRTAAARKEITS